MLNEFLDPATARLMSEAFGGRRVTVPANAAGPAWEHLVEAIGEDRARSVVRWFGGEVLAVPMAKDERIDDTVRALRREGIPVSEIAKMTFPMRLSERHIYRICAADRADRS